MVGCMTSSAWGISSYHTCVNYRVHSDFSTKTDILYNKMSFTAAYGDFVALMIWARLCWLA